MPLPQKVIEQLGREPIGTQGWALGALLFSGGMFFLALLVYFGLAFGYEPYLNNQLTTVQGKVNDLNNTFSAEKQTDLINFYSQITNLQSLLRHHRFVSKLYSWLETNTEANVYFQTLSLTSQNQVTLAGVAASEADVNQQVAIFENSPEVAAVTISSVAAPQATIANAGWTFNMVVTMKQSTLLATSQ